MTDNPLVSVIMSVFNTDETWLKESIQSILDQTYTTFEFIIVLDCPTDDSERIVQEYAAKDQRIVILRNQENIGLTRSLNKALLVAKGEYIARMDADDLSVSTRFEKQVAYMNAHPDVAAVGSKCYLPLSRKPILNNWTEDQDVLAIRLLFANAGLPHPTAMIRRSVLTDNDIRYTESIQKSQDYKLWIDLIPFGKLMVLPDILLFYREHEGQISSDVNALNSYAHQISLMQAEKLLGELNENEKKLHVTVMKTELPAPAGSLDRYFHRIVEANRQMKLYDQEKLERELDYLWCRKAVRRFQEEKKADMLLRARSLCMLRPDMLRYIDENKSRSRDYFESIAMFEKKEMSTDGKEKKDP